MKKSISSRTRGGEVSRGKVPPTRLLPSEQPEAWDDGREERVEGTAVGSNGGAGGKCQIDAKCRREVHTRAASELVR